MDRQRFIATEIKLGDYQNVTTFQEAVDRIEVGVFLLSKKELSVFLPISFCQWPYSTDGFARRGVLGTMPYELEMQPHSLAKFFWTNLVGFG